MENTIETRPCLFGCLSFDGQIPLGSIKVVGKEEGSIFHTGKGVMYLSRYQIYQDVSRQWRWRFVAANGRIIATSGESYWNKADCEHGIMLVKGSSNAPVYEV